MGEKGEGKRVYKKLRRGKEGELEIRDSERRTIRYEGEAKRVY
jgi:hypothetical protein